MRLPARPEEAVRAAPHSLILPNPSTPALRMASFVALAASALRRTGTNLPRPGQGSYLPSSAHGRPERYESAPQNPQRACGAPGA